MAETPAKDILTENNLQDSYWGKTIIQAEEGEGFSNTSVQEASSWVSCACGRLDEGIPRDKLYGEPLDPRLLNLGVTFSNAVQDDDYTLSAIILVGIEHRAVQLLKSVDKLEEQRVV